MVVLISIFYNQWENKIKKRKTVAELLTSNGVSNASMVPPTISSPSALIPMPWYTQSTLSNREQSTYSASRLAETLTATWCHFPSDRPLTGNLKERYIGILCNHVCKNQSRRYIQIMIRPSDYSKGK